MHTQLDIHQHNRIQTLKHLYIGKFKQLSMANASSNNFKYQVLHAELLTIKAAIPEDELPLCI